MTGGIVEPGAEFDIWYWNFVYPCRVVGILEKGATIPESGTSSNPGVCELDSRVLFPFGIKVSYTTEKVDEIKKYAYLSYLSLQFGIAQVPAGKMRQQVAAFYDTGKKFGLPAVRMIGTSMGVDLLRKESTSSVMILLILTITLDCFTLYSLFITFYDKGQSNSRIYGIYMMNGCSLGMILIPLLMEIATVLAPAAFLSWAVFVRDNAGYQADVIVRTSLTMIAMVFVIGAGFIVLLMRGINTEHLIRQKE